MTVTDTARITEINVEGLLGRFDYSIPFDLENRFLILHGPNGVGKTRLLELLHAILSTRHDQLAAIPFRSVELGFDSGLTLEVHKAIKGQESGLFDSEELDEDEDTPDERIEWILKSEGSVLLQAGRPLQLGPRERRHLERLERELPVERVGESLWRDLRTSEDLGPLEIAERFGIDLDSEDRRSPQLDELLNHLRPNVSHLIGAQRLLSAPRHFRPHRRSWQPLRPGDEQPSEPTVVSYARDLTEKLEAALADNSRTSQRLDRSFPRRLFDQADPDVHTEEEIREMFEEQLEIRQRLAEISILDTSHELLTLPLDQLVEWQRKVLSIYLSDASEKLDTFDKLLRTIEPLRDIINKRFLLKRLEIDRDTGFAFYDDVTGKRVQLHHLSSGEQHELVLLYDLLMKVDPSSLVLLDEPEISLHVAWQKAFLDDLERVADLANLRFIVATHSPQIIGNRLDLAHQLGGSLLD